MKTRSQKANILTFVLRGKIGSYSHSSDGPDPFCGKNFEETVQAESSSKAIEMAQGRVQTLLRENADIAPPSSPGGWESTYDFTLTQQVWSMKFVPEEKGQRRIPRIPSHSKEIISI